MQFTPANLEGIVIIEPKIFRDTRGFFMESYNQKMFSENGIDVPFVQDNVSRSQKGSVRGMHYQLLPHAQGKLVTVTWGTVFDVSVDIRKNSPTFGKWFGYTLNDENRHLLYIPPGFAHGFCVLSDFAEFSYKCTGFYVPQAERTIRWNDSRVGIRWPMDPDPRLMSDKDRNAPDLASAENNFN
ncbi:MAG: dTDP-4-dehydrorhamnose 3,5-epimerase [Candidatus Omnitrophica bacterium]|nr:dTDP-4-dehydrorhamnose 3,5-epimerase [Candidatus Omnitrophota bacterium]